MPACDNLSARLLSDPALQRELETESLRARRGRCALSLALFASVDRCADENAAALLSRIRETASPCDSLGRLSDGTYALVLPGAGIFKAQSMVDDILRPLEDTDAAWAAGIAGAEAGENADAEKLLREARNALKAGIDRPGRAVVYRETEEALSIRRTLVHSHEKRFLFSGGI